MGLMVFVPVNRNTALALRETGMLAAVNRVGHAATAPLLRSHDYDESTLEDAEFAALTYAGVQAAISTSEAGQLRLVLAADLAPSDIRADPEDPYGQVAIRQLRWTDVQALFSDEPEARASVTAARSAAGGQPLAAALADPAVEALLERHDLLWFAPDELEHLPV